MKHLTLFSSKMAIGESSRHSHGRQGGGPDRDGSGRAMAVGRRAAGRRTTVISACNRAAWPRKSIWPIAPGTTDPGPAGLPHPITRGRTQIRSTDSSRTCEAPLPISYRQNPQRLYIVSRDSLSVTFVSLSSGRKTSVTRSPPPVSRATRYPTDRVAGGEPLRAHWTSRDGRSSLASGSLLDRMTLRQDSHDSSVTIGPMKTRSCTPPPRSLRILMIAPTSFFADYGCHVRILEEITALQRLGHRVRLCTYHNGRNLPGIDIRRSVDVPWLKRAEVGSSRHKAYLDLALFAETLRQLVAFRPDVIHSHLHEGALIGGVLGRLARRPVVFDYQGSLTEEMLDHGFIRKHGLRERFFRRIERRIDRIADSVVPSGVAARRYLECSGLDPSRIRDIPDAVDLARFDPMAASAGGRAIRE
ncbi:MAG TPA: hypothetical protein DEU95_11000, partial [Chloroflexi bacterium]|nr:hypothetical protein [Chloroflexota bacterium]